MNGQDPVAESPWRLLPDVWARTRYCHHLLGVRDQPALVQGFQDMLPEVGKLRAGDTILKIEARAGMPNGESFAFFASSLRHRPPERSALSSQGFRSDFRQKFARWIIEYINHNMTLHFASSLRKFKMRIKLSLS
jgi:hypothetical protein